MVSPSPATREVGTLTTPSPSANRWFCCENIIVPPKPNVIALTYKSNIQPNVEIGSKKNPWTPLARSRAVSSPCGTSRSRRVRGYMAPEYLEDSVVSTKADVYAVGVVTMELVMGKAVDEA
ncbi:hypothetical protein PR202_gb13191 [Eleusine coracana subsp. coracana]|uniref:Serine-threonine/tyrosine-protein kinase catalytic domain-containing protein n=1 Tax=Eleusine coracana subsp. coracana TaxID=191504 RepID=A0AAV5ERT9_ELECO|nr:hypothetical protein PR202_gb13191 [Eleusine coracana subsp. coracana]